MILGHSFISRFYDFRRFNVRADVNLNLSLTPQSEQVFLRGYPRDQYRLHQRKMFAYGWKRTAGLVLTLKYCYNVQRVAVLQILHR